MRTLNKHPQWHNQPLRLTDQERKNPVMVIQEFFDSYHLEEVRQLLWTWMVEVVTSQRSIANNPRDRNNNIFFYEKIEALVEAAFILKNKPRNKKYKLIVKAQGTQNKEQESSPKKNISPKKAAK